MASLSEFIFDLYHGVAGLTPSRLLDNGIYFLRNVVRLRLILPDRSTKRNESDAFIPPRRLPDVVDGRNEIELVSTQDLGGKRSPTEEKGAGKGGTP